MMNETILLSALRRDIDASTGEQYEKLNYSRAEALARYLGEKYGNEVKGRSQIVTTEVADTVEAMLPQILKVFVASERAVYFEPVGKEDEQAAKQETDYVNHVFYKENPGFEILYTWFKDGLLSKNGFVKYYWEDKKNVTTESYTNLTQIELAELLAEDGVEIEEQTQRVEMMETPAGPVLEPLFDVKIKRTEDLSGVKVVNVPPEELLIDAEFAEQQIGKAPFCAHETWVTLSDLKAMGFDISDIKEYGGQEPDYDDIEQEQRFQDVSDDPFDSDDGNPVDPMMRKVKIAECYKRIDYDEDGYAELRKVVLANDTVILENEEIDFIPFESITPIVMPHRFFGRSAADQTMDLQLQKTMLTRNIMDNLYLINNTRTAAVEGEVNLGDLMDSTPGGVVRMSAPGMAQPLPTQPFTGHAFGMLDYLDSIKEKRTGVTAYNQGMDADSLNKTAQGINRIMDASAQRLELIARLYGEGVKRLMLGVHRLLQQNQDKEKVINMRGQWVPVKPTDWRTRTNMTVVVGLGTENRDKMLGHLTMIAESQKTLMESGSTMVSESNLYNTMVKIVENAGLKHPDLYYTDPATVQPPPPQPDPQMEMVRGQLEVASQQNQVKAQDSQYDYDIKMRELALKAREVAVKEGELQLKQTQLVTSEEDKALDRELEASRLATETIVAAGSPNAQ